MVVGVDDLLLDHRRGLNRRAVVARKERKGERMEERNIGTKERKMGRKCFHSVSLFLCLLQP